MASAREPIYQGLYHGPAGKELTVALRTKPCRFNCIMCLWKPRSVAVRDEDVLAQIHTVLARYKDRIPEVQQFSFGNEGSLLDTDTLNFETLLTISKILVRYFHRISFESHPAFITQTRLTRLKAVLGDTPFELTVGFETSDDDLRQRVMRKPLSNALFEQKLRLLADNGALLKVFIMLKPSPYMTEAEGIADCVRTIRYLHRLEEQYHYPITIHLNPTFILPGSEFDRIAQQHNYTPPTLWSLAEVLHRTQDVPFRGHLGLSTEGLPTTKRTIFRNCDACTGPFLRALKEFNRHHDVPTLLQGLPSCDCRPACITF